MQEPVQARVWPEVWWLPVTINGSNEVQVERLLWTEILDGSPCPPGSRLPGTSSSAGGQSARALSRGTDPGLSVLSQQLWDTPPCTGLLIRDLLLLYYNLHQGLDGMFGSYITQMGCLG